MGLNGKSRAATYVGRETWTAEPGSGRTAGGQLCSVEVGIFCEYYLFIRRLR